MDLMNSLAAGAGEAIVNKMLESKKKRDNIFTRLIPMIKGLIDDPEKMELHAYCENGKVVIKVKPDKEKKKGFVAKVSVFDEEES